MTNWVPVSFMFYELKHWGIDEWKDSYLGVEERVKNDLPKGYLPAASVLENNTRALFVLRQKRLVVSHIR